MATKEEQDLDEFLASLDKKEGDQEEQKDP